MPDRPDIQKVKDAFGNPQPPKVFTQEQFDGEQDIYPELCRTDVPPDPVCLTMYGEDLMYQELQPDLFRYLLPVCLAAWQGDLYADPDGSYGATAGNLLTAMAIHRAFSSMLTQSEYAAVEEFMRASLLDKISREHKLSFSGNRQSPYAWIHALTEFGSIFPTLPDLWSSWWRMEHVGHAVGLLQYISSLMYRKNDNPIFSPWTPGGGGGPPALWEKPGCNEYPWLAENIAFLRSSLTPESVLDGLKRAEGVIRGKMDSSVPDRMVDDFPGRERLVRLRISKLIDYLRPFTESELAELSAPHPSYGTQADARKLEQMKNLLKTWDNED